LLIDLTRSTTKSELGFGEVAGETDKAEDPDKQFFSRRIP